MNLALDIRSLPAYLHATLSGDFVVDDAKAALASIMAAAYAHQSNRLLIDCLGLAGDPSLRERFDVVSCALQLRINAILEGRRPVLRTAIVAVPPLAHPSRYALRLLVERAIKVTICERIEDALAWLGLTADGVEDPQSVLPD